jgi:hypothetical protein
MDAQTVDLGRGGLTAIKLINQCRDTPAYIKIIQPYKCIRLDRDKIPALIEALRKFEVKP